MWPLTKLSRELAIPLTIRLVSTVAFGMLGFKTSIQHSLIADSVVFFIFLTENWK